MKTTVPCYRLAASVYLFFFTLCLADAIQAQKASVPPPDAGSFNNRLAATPLLFTENRGQVADKAGNIRPDVLFTAHSAGAKIYLTATGIHYQFERTILPEGYEKDERKVKDREKQEALRNQVKTQTSRFTLSLKSANPVPHIRKEAQNAYTENFYLANCAITGVHTYERLVYENVYPGIDWVIYSKAKGMEYDFIVHPGANPNLIKLDVKDAKKVSIATDGGLMMATDLGEVKEAAPVSYSGNTEIATTFSQKADGTIGFAVDTWDKSKELRIDPSVTWATYYGGIEDDIGYSCAVDISGNVYLAGSTASTSGIASGGFQNTFGNITNPYNDAFLVKFNSSGARIWATYYGGSYNDDGYSCAVDASGNIYLTGSTGSFTGIASGGFQNTLNGSNDAFLVKFNSSGVRIWATYCGGNSYDLAHSCTLDVSGNIYLAGDTYSTTGIASGGFRNTISGGGDAFLAKFNSNGARIWATYYGGENLDYGYCCAADASGNIYLSGFTASTTGIASGGFRNTISGGGDAFLVKFNSSGARIWATYYGGGGYGTNTGMSCVADAFDNVYLSGSTRLPTGVASGGFKNTIGSDQDAFLVKFNSSGTRLWGTYYGGSNITYSYNYGWNCAVDAYSNVYLTGYTSYPSGIASGGFQNYWAGAYDVFLVKFASNGARLWGTYYGGSDFDYPSFCITDASGNTYLSGYTRSSSGIAFGGFQNTKSAKYDAFLAKINDSNNVGFVSVVNGNWDDPATWSGGIVPSDSSVVFISTSVTVTANTSCYSVKINPSGSVTVKTGVNLTVLRP